MFPLINASAFVSPVLSSSTSPVKPRNIGPDDTASLLNRCAGKTFGCETKELLPILCSVCTIHSGELENSIKDQRIYNGFNDSNIKPSRKNDGLDTFYKTGPADPRNKFPFSKLYWMVLNIHCSKVVDLTSTSSAYNGFLNWLLFL